MLVFSNSSKELQSHSRDQYDNYLCIYGNPAYPPRRPLQVPFREAVLTYEEKADNISMSSLRVSAELIFGDITTQIRFNDSKKTRSLV